MNLQHGQLCKVECPESRYHGRIIEYICIGTKHTNSFSFKTDNDMKITLGESHFIALPGIHELKYLINIALDTMDKEWFCELTEQLIAITTKLNILEDKCIKST